MAGKNNRLLAATVVAGVVMLWQFPLFHVRPLAAPATVLAGGDIATIAEKFWNEQLPSARAADAAVVASALQKDPKAAIKTHGHSVGLAAAYFFVSGEGRVVARERNAVRLALGEGVDAPVVELQLGPIFGNTIRDGTGLLDVNRFSSLQDFNALAAELNQRVESRVLPVLREHAPVGARVSFTGCAEAVEPAPGRPLLSIIPTRLEVR